MTATGNGFEVPKLTAGRQTIELTNGASNERGFILFSPEPGKTLEDIGKWGESGFKGPAPATFLGAMQSLPPRGSVFLTLEFEAGEALRLLRRGERDRLYHLGLAIEMLMPSCLGTM